MNIIQARKELKALLLKLSELEKITSAAGERCDHDPENAEFEKAFNTAYAKEFKVYREAGETLAALIGVSAITARKMIREKRNQIMKIIA